MRELQIYNLVNANLIIIQLTLIERGAVVVSSHTTRENGIISSLNSSTD